MLNPHPGKLSVFMRFLPILSLFLCTSYGLLVAQNNTFDKLTIENGLSQGMIYDVLQSRDGFLWIATKDGLNRYDGYNFKVYSNNPFAASSIGENTIISLFEDSRGLIWAGLESKGIDVFDPKTGLFHHIPSNFGNSRFYESANTNKIVETADGAIWYTQSRGGLIRIGVPPDWAKKLPEASNLESVVAPELILLPDSLPSSNRAAPVESFIDLMLLENGALVASSDRAQYLVNPKTFEAQKINEALLPVRIFNIAISGDPISGDVWCHSVEINRPQEELWHIRNGQVSKMPLSKGAYKWRELRSGKNGHVWFADTNKCWDIAPGLEPNLSKPDYEQDVNFSCWTDDRNGNIWIGTPGYGLRKINPITRKFHLGAKGQTIRGVWAQGDRYFCRNVFDICAYNPETGIIAPNLAFPNAPRRNIGLMFEPTGHIWLVGKTPETTKCALQRYAPGNLITPEKTYPFNAPMTAYDPVVRARDGHIWIAVDDGRLLRFDPVAERFETFEIGSFFGRNRNTVIPIALAEDAQGAIWVGTQTGLLKGTPVNNSFQFQLFKAGPQEQNGLNNNSIATLLADSQGLLWIGTKGGGINILDQRTGKFSYITMADGLLNNVIYGILPGSSQGEYWCSTNRGLARINYTPANSADPKSAAQLHITTFTAAVGLQDNEFNTYAYCRNTNGELLFGGVNGLNRFFPQEIQPDTTTPNVMIVGLEINHRNAGFDAPDSPLDKPVETITKLELSSDQNSLSFEFAVLDLTDPSKNRYRYRLEGLETEWVEIGNRRFAHFSHLEPGRYVLHVQGSNGESDWKDAKPIIIIIHPPWYQTRLAYLCYLILLIWGARTVYKFQITRVKIREQLAFERRETERIKALEQMKTNFFSNITHEFRTPLTLIIEPLRQLLNDVGDPKIAAKIRLAEMNSRQLLKLVNQLLDMAKLESGQMALDSRMQDFDQTLREITERFLPMAEKRQVKLTCKYAEGLPGFSFDKSKVELVLSNLVSNALKFSPAGGAVVLECFLKKDKAGAPLGVAVQVRDNGIGIAAAEHEKIFQRFYQVETPASEQTRAIEGTGIGLALSRELTLLMGGTLSLESDLGKGAVFTFYLPFDLGNPVVNVAPLHEEPVTAKAEPSGSGMLEGEQPVLLLVEDNDDLRKFIKESVGSGWLVVEATHGEEGVRKAQEILPDLIISDVMMPYKDGYALCDEVKNNELTAHIPVILLTAKSSLDSRLKGLKTGADEYLGKPFNAQELRLRMENLVTQRRKLRALYLRETPVAETTTQRGNSEKFLSKHDRAFLQKCYTLMEECLDDETMGVEEFAQKLFVSRVQLHRKLKAIADQSPIDFMRNYRLERAMLLLKNGEGNVAEVSRMVGFVNEKHFSTVFKARFGLSPSEV